MNSKIINLFGGPGIGKSSIASGLTYKLKKKHINCDNPYEFPKLLAWDENYSAISDQLYVVANQHRGIVKSYGKVDYIILDSPILLSLIYKDYYNKQRESDYPSKLYRESFDNMILDMHNGYDNINILLKRGEGKHNDKERYHNLEESKELDSMIQESLDFHGIEYHVVEVGKNTLKDIYNIIKNIK
jgi:deoxyadenosine/deoxycytidine kinase